MTETQTGTLVSVKTVTAENIVAALGIERTEATVKAVEQHIGDEMAAIQSHVVMALADVHNSYEQALTEFKSTFSFVRANKVAVAAAAAVVFVLGALFGHVV